MYCNASCKTCVQGSPSTCLSCPTNKFLTNARCEDTCPSGQIAEESLCKGARTIDQNLCSPGTFNSIKGQSSSTSCSACGPGKYCPGFKGTSQSNCDAGYYCTSNAAYAKNHDEVNGIGTSNSSGGICNQGYYCPSGSSAPIICEVGKYCQTKGLATVTGNCLAGYQCQAGSTSPTPKQCPVGHYCPSGQAAQRCPIGTYLQYQGATRIQECRACDPGFFCNARGASAVTGQCVAGYYCSGGASSANQNICPKGYKCPAGSRSPTPCPLSEYQDSQGQSTCKPCTAGYYCTQTQIIVCPAGYYCLANNVRKPCPIGTFRSGVQGTQLSDCSNCPAGYACMRRAMTNGLVKSCAPGYYCSGKATTDMPRSSAEGGNICTKGFYCPQRSSAPISCDAGKYCPNEGAVLPAGSCQPGYYCSGGSATSIPTGSGGNICPVGRYCPGGSSSPQQCPIPSSQYINYQGADDSGDCLQCPAGKTCADGKIASVDCPAGFYCDHDGTRFPCNRGHQCPQGSRDQIPCQPGEYQPNTQQGVCLTCPAGKHCQGLKVISPRDCPDGYYCLAGTYSQHLYPCPPGYRGKGPGKVSQADSCQLCDAGQFCPKYGMIQTDTLPCNAGFFCIEGAKVPAPNSASDSIGGLTKAGPCPAGQYCSQGVSAGTKCPHGTFRPYDGGRDLGDCLQVPIGKFSTQTGLVNLPTTASSSYGDCAGGYVCTGGSYSRTPQFSTIGKVCPVGHYCPQGATIEIACRPGWYQKNTQQAACTICQDGTYCPNFGTVTPTPCPKGAYCKKLTSQVDGPTVPTLCPRGTYNPNSSSVNLNACLPCPVGKYCPDLGMQKVTENCRAGHICVSGSDIPNPQAQDYSSSNTVNGLCPKGYSCTSGTFNPSQCQPGFFNPSLGQSVCISCPPGYFCNAVAMTSVSTSQQCSAGYYCIGQSRIATQTLCPSKNQCEKGSAFTFLCQDGKFQPLAGQGTCSTCQQGKLCRKSQVFDCGQRRYCPAGKGYGVLCDNGFFQTQASHNSFQNSQCNVCSRKKFCMGGSQIGPCQRGHNCLFGATQPAPKSEQGAFLCPQQHYCLPDSDPTKCPTNKYTQNTGSIQASDCVTCPLGKLCNGQSQSDCPLGFYCQGGISKSCPVTTVRDQQAITDYQALGRYLADCIPCPAGFFCNTQGIADRNTKKCSAGYYCVAKATQEIPCPKATYSVEGSRTRSDCLACPSGYYCGQRTSSPVLCQDNYFCNRSSTPQPCPAGQQCKIVDNDQPGSSFAKKMQKTPCPQGFYCQYGNAGPQRCQADKFCPQGSQYEQPCNINAATNSCNQCLPGQFRFGINQCSACPAGYICLGNTTTKFPIDRATDNGYQCPKGHYCPQSSSQQTPCPIGTYNPSKLGSSINSCIACPEGTYNDITGQYQCKSCGPFATSDLTKTTCTCIGAFRFFGKEDGSCRCQTGYTFETERGQNSANNCEPVQISAGCSFDHIGRCSFSCQTQCGNQTGLLTDTGICQCVADADSGVACDANCQNQFLQVTLTPNLQVKITLPSTGQSVTFPLSGESGIFGQPNCPQSGQCSLVSTVSGGVTSYQPDAYLVNKFRATYPSYSSSIRTLQESTGQRNLQSQVTTSFNSPVFCLIPGTTVSFDTSGGNYPIYLKDSLMNTNKSFDYSQFSVLGSRISQGRASIQTFYFTFNSQGVYVFEDSINKGYKYIYKISSSQCTADNKIQQLSNTSLSSLSIVQDSARVNQQIPFNPDILQFIITEILILISAALLLAKCLKLDRYDFEMVKDKGGIDHSKGANDLRLLAVKRKLQEMIRYINEAEGKSHGKGEELEKQNMEKVDKFEREINMLLQQLGLEYDDAADLLDQFEEDFQDSSDRTSRLSSQGGSGGNEMKKFGKGFDDDDQGKDQQISKIQSNQDGQDLKQEGDEQEQDDDEGDLGDNDQNLLVRNDLPQEHKNFINGGSTRRQIENKKAEFEAQLRKQGLSDDDKKKQIEEFQAGLKNLQRQLQEDSQRQKQFLLAQLKLRKKKGNQQDVQKLAEIQEKEKDLREKHLQEQKQVFNQLSQKERQIENDYDKELKDLKRAEIRQKNESLKKFKQDFHKRLKGVSDPNQIRRLQEENQRQYKEFLNILEKEQQDQNKNNYAKLQQRKQKRLEKAKAQYDKSVQQLKADQNSQMLKEVLEDKMQLQIGLVDDQDKPGNNFTILIQMLDMFGHLDDDQERKSLEAKQKLQRKVELQYLKNQHNIDKNLMENNFKQQEQQMIQQMNNRQLVLPSEEELTNKRADFKQKLNNAGSEAERKRLMKQLEIEEEKLMTALELEKRDQQHVLKKRKLQIQQRKQLKLLEMEREQEKQRNMKEIQILEEQDSQREDQEVKRVYKIIEQSLFKPVEGQHKMERRQLPGAVDSFLNQFNTEQLKNLINRQFLELSRQLAGLLASNQNYKIHQIKFARENFANRMQELIQNRGIKPDRKQVLVEQLKAQENEAVNDIDAKYKLKQMDDQGKLRSRLAKKHAQDKDNLKQRQFEGKANLLDDIIQKYGGDDPDTIAFLQKMKEKLLQSSADEMREFSDNVKKEREQNLQQIKKRLFFENEQQLANFEQNFQKELEQERKRIDKRLQNEKKDMILQRKASFEERLKRMEGMAQANIDVYMAEHQQNLQRLQQALDNEREKQHSNIKEKIKLRKLKQLKRAALQKEKQRVKQLDQQKKLQKQKNAILFVAEKAKEIKKKHEQKKKQEQEKKKEEKKVNNKFKDLVINPDQAGIDYRAMVKQWANRVQLHPPQLGEMQNTFDHHVEDSTMEYGIFADLDTPIKRGSSHRTEFNDDEIMQRVMKIDKMVRSLVKK